MKSYFLLFLVLILTVFLFTSGSAQELKVADCMTFAKVSKETSSTSETVFIIEEGYTYQLDGSKDRYLKVIRNDELEGYIALGSISKSARYVIRSIVNEKIASDTVLQKNITESKIESKSKSKKVPQSGSQLLIQIQMMFKSMKEEIINLLPMSIIA